MGTRRKSRELALQMLFQADLGEQHPDEVRKTFWKGRGDVGGEVQGFAEDIFRVAQDRSADIDKLINGVLDSVGKEIEGQEHGRISAKSTS
jgi:N utilization substance protein B